VGTTTSRLSLQPFLNFGASRPLIAVAKKMPMPAFGAANRNATNWARVSREFRNGRELEAQASSSETEVPFAIAVTVRSMATPISPFARIFSGHKKSSFKDTRL
jgi:hypothetical protein